MEPDVMPLPSYSPPPLDGDSDDEVGSEEDEFGDFSVGGVCSPLGHPDVTEPPPFFKQTSPIDKPATHLLSPSFNHLAERTQHTPSEESGNCNPESSLHPGSVASCSVEETGFADFTLFTEQVGHPWCCGFTEQWDGKVEEGNHSVDEHIPDSGREVVMESEPRSQHVCKANGGVCVENKHCEKRNATLVQTPQDHRGSQKEKANIHFGSAEERLNIPRNTPTFPQTITVEGSASDDRASCHNELSLEGASAELEPNVLSHTSQDGQTDDAKLSVMMENCGNSDSLVSSSMADLGLSQSEMVVSHCNATQETSATSCQPHSGTHTQEKCTHFIDINTEHHREPVETADTGVQSLGTLPPSDSFADFCSAPVQDGEEGPTWADFTDQRAPAVGRTWREPVNEDKWEESEEDGVTRINRCQASLSCHVQQLLQSSFPEIQVPAVEGEEDLPNLGALLHTQDSPEAEEDIPELHHALRIQQLMLSLREDVHCSLGLQFKWGGSHSNTTLLRCLGVDPRNIVFIGTKKQAVTVPAYASSLGMLDPTKDPSPAVCSIGRTAVSAPSGPVETQESSTHSVQELPLNKPDWSYRGLSSSQEVWSSFNLDYFGSEDESRTSSSSRASSPPPGVDRELYELIICKLVTGNENSQREDTLNRLMSAAERTSISTRKPSAQEELSAEAGRRISELPDLSFMQAKVLMFPIFLAPNAHSSPKLL
ncbi:hypothetical protein AMECASPLE_007511 [Ameca splendens]|uniref:Aftiphilin clathrin-binding box domain-containing protein n=1 Tax=Ameca splendens TaxID=208324 RepID=A0ABV0YZ39_9TELE